MKKEVFKQNAVAIYNHARRKIDDPTILNEDESKVQRIVQLVMEFLIEMGMPTKPVWLWVIGRVPALARLIRDIANIVKE